MEPESRKAGRKRIQFWSTSPWINWVVVLFIAFVLAGVLLGPVGNTSRAGPHSLAMQASRSIALMMFQYSIDHNGHYPEGASSTEIFQKLIGGKYANDPAIFYLQMPGKTPTTSFHLEPNNVAWDVTSPVANNSPDDLPIVFSTGFRIEYKPGGRAFPLSPKSGPDVSKGGIAVTYHSNAARFLRNDQQPDGTVFNLIPKDANLGTETYHQLTPTGPLPDN
jgi:hypothetical protein